MNVTEQTDILTQLSGKHANFRGRNLSIVDLRKLAADLKDNTTLEILNLSYNALQVTGIKTVVSGLLKNTKLRHLNLAYTSLGDEGAKIVADLLESNTSIQHIDLSGNQITSAGATAIANTLCVNTSLQYLNMFDNNIRDTGAAAIATSPGKLQFLGLSKNKITNHAVPSLCRAMNETKMTKLHLHSNKIGDAGCAKLIKEGTSLLVLNLSCNFISQSASSRFQVTTDIPMLDLAYQKTPAITTPIPTSPIPTSLPKRVQKSEGSQNAARKMQSTRALNIAAASADDGSGYDYFSLPALTVDFVQAQMTLVSKQMEVRSLKSQLESLNTEITTSQAVLDLLNEKVSVTQQAEATKARITSLQEEQNTTNNKLQTTKNQSKQILESLQGLNLVAAHLEAVYRQSLGEKLKNLPEAQQKLEVLKQIQDYTCQATLEPTNKDLTKIQKFLETADSAKTDVLSATLKPLDLSIPISPTGSSDSDGKRLERQPSARSYLFGDVQSARSGKLIRRMTANPVSSTVETETS